MVLVPIPVRDNGLLCWTDLNVKNYIYYRRWSIDTELRLFWQTQYFLENYWFWRKFGIFFRNEKMKYTKQNNSPVLSFNSIKGIISMIGF